MANAYINADLSLAIFSALTDRARNRRFTAKIGNLFLLLHKCNVWIYFLLLLTQVDFLELLSTFLKVAKSSTFDNTDDRTIEISRSRSPPLFTKMSKQPCSSVLVQRCWSAPDHGLCQRSPTGSSEVVNCNRWPVFQHRWTTSLEHSACFCSWHKLVLALRETPESVSLCLTATAPLNTLTYLLT